MDAVDFLISEHDKFRRVFAAIASGNQTEKAREKSFAKLLLDLKVHERMEQREWYPYLRTEAKLVKHLLSEENAAAKAIQDFKKVYSDTLWWRKFTKLQKAVLHHAAEEEKKLFPKARKLLTSAELHFIGRNMRRFKRTQTK